jgi:hypothetical protein
VLRLTDSPRYLHHRGKPLLAIWGFGAAGRPGTPAQALELIDFLKQRAEPAYQITLFGGVTRDWRSDPAWYGVFRAFDVVSPWSVGRYRDDAGDHVPTIPGDEGRRQAFAYTFGYIKALIRALDAA